MKENSTVENVPQKYIPSPILFCVNVKSVQQTTSTMGYSNMLSKTPKMFMI